MEIANIHEAKSQLSKLIEHALNGEEVIIARAGWGRHFRSAAGGDRKCGTVTPE